MCDSLLDTLDLTTCVCMKYAFLWHPGAGNPEALLHTVLAESRRRCGQLESSQVLVATVCSTVSFTGWHQTVLIDISVLCEIAHIPCVCDQHQPPERTHVLSLGHTQCV